MKPLTEAEILAIIAESHARILANEDPRTPYPWCRGNPTKEDCIRHGYCRRDPNCGE